MYWAGRELMGGGREDINLEDFELIFVMMIIHGKGDYL